jgi:nucleotidyltransferase substrate binding protein (TIGR01987 family)
MARRALSTLRELPLSEGVADIVRDAAIQRFEDTFEATWKAAQTYLAEVEGIEVASPRGVIRAAFRVGLLTEFETRRALGMVDDRNASVHTYT